MSQEISAPLIPRNILFGNPDKSAIQLSPDGTQISYLAPVDGVLNVWVGPVNNLSTAKPITQDTGRGIRSYTYAYTNDHILYRQDRDGDENWQLYCVRLDTGVTQDLTPLQGIQARIQQVSPKFPHEVLVALNDRDLQLHDLYRVHIDTGEKHLVQENEGFTDFITDDDYQIRFAIRITSDGGSEVLRLTEAGDWQSFAKIAMEDRLTTEPVGIDQTGKTLYMIDSRNRNTAALVALDIESGEDVVLAEDPRADMSDVMIHQADQRVLAAAFTYKRKHWQALEESVAPDFAYLSTVFDGDFEVVSQTRDERYWIVAYVTDCGPVRYYHYDRRKQSAQFLFTDCQGLEGLPLAKMYPVVIPSRDGFDLVSYYTLPVGSDSDGDGRPDAPLPLVLGVHGGPWSRDVWGYNAWHQWLANRGYAVLSVNFRGSTGFGKAFLNASIGEWGGKMHDDLIDAVHWALREEIGVPERVAILGGSYGGYATLVALSRAPEVFACGIDIMGPSNLVTFVEAIPPYWRPAADLWATRMGDHRTEDGRAFLTERSPLTHVDRIQRPLLIGHGANDPRAKQSESDQIVQAMEARNRPVTYVLYPDEGHGFARPENRLSFSAIAEIFLSQYLGGRCEPIGDDFRDSSLLVPTGAEEVPGLTEALAHR